MSKLSSTWTALAAAVVIVVAAMGCHPSNPIVGKWQITQTVMGAQLTVTREFKSDGTESLTNPAGMDAQMRYTVEGNELHERATAITIGGHTITIGASSPANAQKEIVETFTISGDKLTLDNRSTGVAVSQIYTRVPS